MLHKGFISYIVELDLQTQLKKNNLLKSNKFIANHFNEKNRLSSIIKLSAITMEERSRTETVQARNLSGKDHC